MTKIVYALVQATRPGHWQSSVRISIGSVPLESFWYHDTLLYLLYVFWSFKRSHKSLIVVHYFWVYIFLFIHLNKKSGRMESPHRCDEDKSNLHHLSFFQVSISLASCIINIYCKILILFNIAKNFHTNQYNYAALNHRLSCYWLDYVGSKGGNFIY